MRQLPFVVQPKRTVEKIQIGTSETGIFEIERRGYLTVTEKAAFQQVITSKDSRSAYKQVIDKISSEQNLKVETVNNIVGDLLQGKTLKAKDSNMLDQYAEDLLILLEVFKREATHTQLVMATILLMSRVDSDWSFEDTAALDTSLIEHLAELYQSEESRSMEALSFMQPPKPATEGESGEVAEPGK